MDRNSASAEVLLARIQELEVLNRALLEEKEQETRLEYAWSGNLGHWYWNVKTNAVTFNPLKVTALGYTMDEVPAPVPFQFFTDRLHPEDYEPTMRAMRDHLEGKSPIYEVEYRIRAKSGTYKWYYDRGKITQYDGDHRPLFLAGIVFDITEKTETQLELERRNRLLSEMSSRDGLTHVFNHRALMEILQAEMHKATATGRPLSVVLFDLDDFKNVNDTRGHVYGDRVLVTTARVIREQIRDADAIGRYGGEEFLLLLPDTGLEAAVKVADRIRRAIADETEREDLRVTVSGGAACFDGQSPTELVHAADLGLYAAKRAGKNLIEPAFTPQEDD